MSFKKESYEIVKNAITKDLAGFCHSYITNKRTVARHLKDSTFLSPYDQTWGVWADEQVPGTDTYAHYADLVMETLLVRLKGTVEKITGLRLVPSYSYVRIYRYGDKLLRHRDRKSCEISGTMHLGGDPWDLYIEPTGKLGKKGIKADLGPGDILIYRGCDLEHWREMFEGTDCAQVFFHYRILKGNQKHPQAFDGRPMLGLPNFFAPAPAEKEK